MSLLDRGLVSVLVLWMLGDLNVEYCDVRIPRVLRMVWRRRPWLLLIAGGICRGFGWWCLEME